MKLAQLLSLAAVGASAFFFAMAVFDKTLGDVKLIPAGLLSLASAFLIDKLAVATRT